MKTQDMSILKFLKMTRILADLKIFLILSFSVFFYPGSLGTVPDYSLRKYGVIW